MEKAGEQQPHNSVEVIKKCPKCGEEYAQNFTPRVSTDWAEIEKAISEDTPCPKCAYFRRLKIPLARLEEVKEQSK